MIKGDQTSIWEQFDLKFRIEIIIEFPAQKYQDGFLRNNSER